MITREFEESRANVNVDFQKSHLRQQQQHQRQRQRHQLHHQQQQHQCHAARSEMSDGSDCAMDRTSADGHPPVYQRAPPPAKRLKGDRHSSVESMQNHVETESLTGGPLPSPVDPTAKPTQGINQLKLTPDPERKKHTKVRSLQNPKKPRNTPEPSLFSQDETQYVFTPDDTSEDRGRHSFESLDASQKNFMYQPARHPTVASLPASLRPSKSHLPALSSNPRTTTRPQMQDPRAERVGSLGARDTPNSSQELIAHQSPVALKSNVNTQYPGLLPQPESREISPEQLTTEVKSIYNGITVIESRCIHVDRVQIMTAKAGQKSDLTQDHWQALIAIHRTLLHEHHDFFLASQHPSASPALRRLAERYSMPARFWRHGIHSFLEVLRHRLPESLDHMLAFLYHAYQMLALLYETVPTFETTWMECLGDLGRYRMAIEDDDRDREVWTGVARYWYRKTADRSPQVGRLYHHLAILSRPNALQQLYLYSRSLTSQRPFEGTRESIMTLFDPILTNSLASYGRVSQLDILFISAVSCLFRKSYDDLIRFADDFIRRLEDHISHAQSRWKEQGVYIAVTIISSILDFGSSDSSLFRAFQERNGVTASQSTSPAQEIERPQGSDRHAIAGVRPQVPAEAQSEDQLTTHLKKSWYLCVSTMTVVFHRHNDANVYPFVHTMLLFFYNLERTQSSYAGPLLRSVPWKQITDFLNVLSQSEKLSAQATDPAFPRPERGDWRPLPEDFLIQEQVWTFSYFPRDWFKNTMLDAEERTMELASTTKSRAQRILWLGVQIASSENWIQFDSAAGRWSLADGQRQTRSVAPSLFANSPFVPTPSCTDDDVVMDDLPDQNVEMVDAEPLDDTGEPEPQMTTMQRGQQLEVREPETGPQHQRRLSSTDSAGFAKNMLLHNYTVLVLDEGMLLNHQDVFTMLLDSQDWNVVVSSVVMRRLIIRHANTHDVAAGLALAIVKEAVRNKQKIRILEAKGEDVTRKILETPPCQFWTGGTESSDEASIKIARQQSDLASHTRDHPAKSHKEAKPAVLVTEDTAVGKKAMKNGVTHIAISLIKNLIRPPKGGAWPTSKVTGNAYLP